MYLVAKIMSKELKKSSTLKYMETVLFPQTWENKHL